MDSQIRLKRSRTSGTSFQCVSRISYFSGLNSAYKKNMRVVQIALLPTNMAHHHPLDRLVWTEFLSKEKRWVLEDMMRHFQYALVQGRKDSTVSACSLSQHSRLRSALPTIPGTPAVIPVLTATTWRCPKNSAEALI